MCEKKTICDRCGMDISQRIGKIYEKLFPHDFEDECGETVHMDLCWDCDFDTMNGGDPFQDAFDVRMQRWENDYAYDPINTPPPPGYV